ncbi:MAG: DNA repair protein MmcB-related protein [Methylacidiphilales bacterium]|nr:DNA repair protein MmcB-related protein [Candidatus Methylacidiphilales bacterium]NJR14924.1 DNA repair protein MmcB-related protein [Calothrix sp. CSU_2_0]
MQFINTVPTSKSSEGQLEEIEVRLSQLLSRSRADWTELAKLTLKVQQQKLYKQKGFSSFSAWIRQLAVNNNREPSLLWRFVKAAKYFLKLTGSDDLEQVGDAAKIAPEALERLEKVQRQAPTPVFETLRERVFAGDVTVAECRQIEKDYRPPATEVRTNRGRPPKGEEGRIEYLGQWKDASNFSTFIERSLGEKDVEAVTIPNPTNNFTYRQVAPTINRALKADFTWMQECAATNYPPQNWGTHLDVTVGEESQKLRLDLVGVVRWNMKFPKDLFAVKIVSDANDFEFGANWGSYLNFCNYFCFACPIDDVRLLEAIQETVSQFDFIGVLGVDFAAKLNNSLTYPIQVVRRPQRHGGAKICSVYETLYERVLGWSVADFGE